MREDHAPRARRLRRVYLHGLRQRPRGEQRGGDGLRPFGSTQALYYTSYANRGEVRGIAFTGNGVPTARLTASPRSGAPPLRVSFDGGASTDPDPDDSLTYLWNFGDGSAAQQTATPTTSHVYDASSPFPPPRSYAETLRVRDSRGAISDPVTVPIDVGNTPPTPKIEFPSTSLRFHVGQQISLEGSATDAEEGSLSDTRLTWEIVRVHNEHTHPFLSGHQGSDAGVDVEITGPDPEDLAAAATSHLELRLTATDSLGGSAAVTRDVLPRLVQLSFETEPSGLELTIEGMLLLTPSP